jgi:pilus assembly protein CpaE
MSAPRSRFDVDAELDQLAHDVDLDMDAPIGATFAAALRSPGPSTSPGDDSNRKSNHGPDADGDDGVLVSDQSYLRGAYGTVRDDVLIASASLESFDAKSFADDFSETGESADDRLTVDTVWSSSETESFDAAPFTADFAEPRKPVHDLLAADSGWSAPVSENADQYGSDADAQLGQAVPAYDEVEDFVDEAAGQGLGYDYSFATQHAGGDRTIPRIAIHAFCMRPGTMGLMQTISRDRRMRNVALDMFEGGVETAIKYYVNETTPNLLVIEGSENPRELLADLDSLAEYCDENIKVVIIGQTNDIRLYRELMRRGVSEYLVAPIDPVQMIRAIAALFTDPEAPFIGKTLAVTGVKGGVGASSIAHNLAWALTERCKVNATLVDLDLNFGTTGLDFNQDSTATIADALMSPDRFDDAVMSRLITRATDRLSLFTAPATLDRTYNLDPETYSRVLDQVRRSVPFMLLDLPHIWTDWFKTTVISADDLIIVACPDLASLRNGKNLVDFLKAARPNDNPPKLILNMVGLPKRPEIPPKDFGQAIGLEPVLVLPFDAQLFGTAANNGQMVFDVAPESKIAMSLDQLASTITGKEVKTSKPSMLKKLLGR